MDNNRKSPSGDETSAGDPIDVADLPKVEKTVTGREAEEVKGGVTKVNAPSLRPGFKGEVIGLEP